MTSISSFLPPPKENKSEKPKKGAKELLDSVEVNAISRLDGPTLPPLYGQRTGWMPRTLKDFGDGGAFPEIHVAQYPLEMGRKVRKASSSSTIAVRTDDGGNVRYDAIARRGHSEDRIVHSAYKDMIPKNIADNDPSFLRPSAEAIQKTKEKTQAALERLLNAKAKNANPSDVKTVSKDPTYISYTPNNPETGISNRIIRVVDAPVDPLDPPRFKHKKLPRGPGSPPAPVMHSPPRKITAEEQKAWYIPPCVSNWKNHKGFTIPLDKRLAADGRGLQEVTINDKFAKFAEALYVADRHSREEIEKRQQLQRKLAEKEKESKEEHLRELARRAREERAGITLTSVDSSGDLAERERIRRDREYEIKQEVRKKQRLAEKGRTSTLNDDF